MAAGGNIVGKLATAGNFTLHVAKADFKFNAAHFMLFSVRKEGSWPTCFTPEKRTLLQEGRERMHGHNYSVFVSESR